MTPNMSAAATGKPNAICRTAPHTRAEITTPNMARLRTVFSTVLKVSRRVRMAASKIRGGTMRPSMRLLSKLTSLSTPPILKNDSAKPIAIMTVGYEVLSLSLKIAPRNDRKMTNETIVNEELAKATMFNA
jgi:hypothetical protein